MRRGGGLPGNHVWIPFVLWQVFIPHDGDGSAWWNSVYMDHQVIQGVHKSVWGVAISLVFWTR
jgi:hypothetical protein